MDPAPQQPSLPDVEVIFCDLCNASVPEQDLQAGKAARHGGHVVGACCLQALRGASPVAVPGRAERRSWPLALLGLAALLAATLHLDHRIEADRAAREQAQERLAEELRQRSEVLMAMDATLDGVAESLPKDISQLQGQLGLLHSAVLEEALRSIRSLQASQATFGALRTDVEAFAGRQVDPRPALERLEAAVQSIQAQLAELSARPASGPAVPQPAIVPAVRQDPSGAPPSAGLPSELAHQVARLADADPAVRFDAVDALVRSKDPQAGTAVLPLARDGDLFVRRLAVEGLRYFRSVPVLDALVRALADPEELVRETAWRSLQELTGQKLPFDAAGSRENRTRAQKAWADWAEANKANFGGT